MKEKVASIAKYKDSEQFLNWINELPQKYSIEKIEKILKVAKNKAKFVIWTEKSGLKLLK